MQAVATRCRLLSSDWGGVATWGNSTAISRAAAGRTAVQTAGAASGKVGLVGVSMGGGLAINYAKSALANVSWIILVIPALDQQYARVQDTVEGIAGLRASIDAATGVTYPAALPANQNPIDNAAAITSIPILMFVCSDDDVSTGYATFAANHGNCTTVQLGALGHTEAAVSAVNVDTVVAFIDAHP